MELTQEQMDILFDSVGTSAAPTAGNTTTGGTLTQSWNKFTSTPTTSITGRKSIKQQSPYNINMQLNIMAKNQDDGLQILEQILPFFQPSFSMSLKFIPDMNEVRDIAVVLNSVDFDDDWEDDFSTRRSITYSMQFTAKSYIYGPYTKADVIRKSRIIETLGDQDVNKRHVELTYTPKAKTDINQDGQVTAADDALVTADDDFGFNEGMTFL